MITLSEIDSHIQSEHRCGDGTQDDIKNTCMLQSGAISPLSLSPFRDGKQAVESKGLYPEMRLFSSSHGG